MPGELDHHAVGHVLGAQLAEQAEALVAKAHTICPYSKATRGNIDVKLLANGKPVEGG